jgi:hypothetical protein
MHYFRVQKLWSIHVTPLDPKMMFGSVSEHFANLRHVKRGKTCVSSLNALTFATLKGELVFRAWMHYFRVPKLWSIHFTPLDPKWCLGLYQGISLTFTTLKDGKLVFWAWIHYFGVPKLRSIHSTQLEPKWCLGVFWSISLTFGMKKDAKLVFRARMNYFGVPKMRIIYCAPLEPKWCLWLFWSISLTFCT